MAKTPKEDNISFDDVPESKQQKVISEAGIYRNFFLEAVEYQNRQEKMEKRKNAKGDMEEVGTGKITGPWFKITLRGTDEDGDEVKFISTIFQPPTNEEEVKFQSDKYEGGVAVRKHTKEEMIRLEFTKKFYFFEQLAKALTINTEKINSFKKSVNGSPDVLFKLMFDKFFTMFPMVHISKKPIDFKCFFNNNLKAKTSFLQLAEPSANNIIFAQHIGDKSSLVINSYELTKMKRMFTNTDRAPKADGTEIDSKNQWKQPEIEGPDGTKAPVSDEDLF